MDARQRERMVVAHAALSLLRQRDFRTATADTNAMGERVIVPALLDDPMGYFFDQLRNTGGPIYAALLVGESVAVVGMVPRRPPGHDAPLEDDGCLIHRDSEIGMVLEHLRAHGKPITCCEAPTVLVELVDDGQVGVPC